MQLCPKCGFQNEDSAQNCAKCRVNLKWALENKDQLKEVVNTSEQEEESLDEHSDILATTTLSVEGRSISRYLDVLTAEVVLGTGILSELKAGIADTFGTRSGGFQDKLRRAKTLAIRDLRKQALQMGADAVVGVNLNYMTFSNNMIMVSAVGTAVNMSPSAQNEKVK